MRKKEQFLRLLRDIENAKHVEIVVKREEFLPSASALYTYVLQLHKKVSLVCLCGEVEEKFSFLPWFDKIKYSSVSSSDFVIKLDEEIFGLYEFFKTNNIKINKKISTALYASLLLKYDGFTSKDMHVSVFGVIAELVSYGADYKSCSEFLLKRTTLAKLRLKSLMLKNMLLKEDATKAVFVLHDDDIKSSGATLRDAQNIMQEAFGLKYVKQVVLMYEDKIIKSIKKDI